ncbi:MAG TPA: hypothetical protein VN847_27080 [Streptosporangiaceae bacterium]|nr:hypothetical protein [Streptosporangiaceae bacterium]
MPAPFPAPSWPPRPPRPPSDPVGLVPVDRSHRAWLITAAGRMGGFMMTAPDERT